MATRDAHVHIDLEQDVKSLLEKRENDLAFRAICEGEEEAMSALQNKGSLALGKIEEEASLGATQVQSLLRFCIEREIERAFEEAEGDNIVYDGLGEHRILGKAKKKKSRRAC